MASVQRVVDDSDPRCYFSQVPHLADDELDPFEMRLYVHYLRVCGAGGGACWESVKTTAEKCRMSTGKVSKTRRSLAEKRFIRVQGGDHRNSTPLVTMQDRWAENMQRYSPERSPDERSVHQMNEAFTTRTKRSPGETKNNSLRITEEEVNGGRATAADEHITISDLETALKGINKGLVQPFTGVKALAAKLHQRGEAARTVNEAWAACQVAANPAGAFMLWMKDGYIPTAPVARRTKRGGTETHLRPATTQPTEEEVAAYIASTTPLPEWKYE